MHSFSLHSCCSPAEFLLSSCCVPSRFCCGPSIRICCRIPATAMPNFCRVRAEPLSFLPRSCCVPSTRLLPHSCYSLAGFLMISCWVPAAPPCRFCCFLRVPCTPPMYLLWPQASFSLHFCHSPAKFLLRLLSFLLRSCCVPCTHLLLHSCYSPAGFLMIPCSVFAAPPVVFAALLLQPC